MSVGRWDSYSIADLEEIRQRYRDTQAQYPNIHSNGPVSRYIREIDASIKRQERVIRERQLALDKDEIKL